MTRPPVYARGKLERLLRRWNGAAGDHVRRHGPRVFAGVPPTALMGLTASSEGQHEVAGDPRENGSAVGLFGVEGPQIARLAVSDACRELLGRPARVGLTEAGYLGDLEGQVVTGLLNYQRHMDLLVRVVPRSTWEDEVAGRPTSFPLRCCVAAYSSGEGVIGAALRHYERQLVEELPEHRWPRMASLVSTERAAAIEGVPIRGEWKVAFMVIRAEQRLESGLALNRAVGESTPGAARDEGWFAPWSDDNDELVDALIQLATGRVPASGGGTSTSRSARRPLPNPTPSSAGGWLVGLGLLATGAWWKWRSR